ncbi:MAG: hypothetical protein KY469_09670 [Actinobacteria bacterium]|nr:hypothetical protein [Actinomycetota bacterium]
MPEPTSTVAAARPATAAAVGGALGLATWPALVGLPDTVHVPLLAVLLGAIAGIYVGFGLRDGRTTELVVESVVAAAFVAVAVLALATQRTWLLAVGLAAHGVWDIAHHPRHGMTTHLPRWYPPMCAVYDVVVAVGIVVLAR